MCEPTTLAMASTAFSATQGIVGYMGASADAAAQDAMYEQNQTSATESLSAARKRKRRDGFMLH